MNKKVQKSMVLSDQEWLLTCFELVEMGKLAEQIQRREGRLQNANFAESWNCFVNF